MLKYKILSLNIFYLLSKVDIFIILLCTIKSALNLLGKTASKDKHTYKLI